MLARDPEDITVFEVIEALEGHLLMVTCVGNNASDCAKSAQCALQDLWCQVDRAIENVLKETTLKHLAKRQVSYDQATQPMYYI